jgi:hypothetical protein
LRRLLYDRTEMSAVGISGAGAAAVIRGPARESEGTQLPGSNAGVLVCECGEEIGVEACWECGAVLCSECSRIRMIDGYEVVYCPVCAPAGDE